MIDDPGAPPLLRLEAISKHFGAIGALRGAGFDVRRGVFAGVLLHRDNVMGMPPHFTQMIQGGLVLAAVLLDTLKTTIRKRYL